MTGLNDSSPDAAIQQVTEAARALANLRHQLSRCDFCGHLVRMQRSVHLGIALEKCPACHCEGFAP